MHNWLDPKNDFVFKEPGKLRMNEPAWARLGFFFKPPPIKTHLLSPKISN